jgi:predicted DNA-binding protein with PD1-like motif
MTYNRIDDKIIIRLARGENIFTDLYKILKIESVRSAWINGIGAIENVEVGSYDLKNKRYNRVKLEGVYELTSLMGNLSYKEGEPFLHLHVNLSDHECKSYGGHLFTADINATGEFIIHILNVDSNRVYNENIGLHLLEFKNCEK